MINCTVKSQVRLLSFVKNPGMEPVGMIPLLTLRGPLKIKVLVTKDCIVSLNHLLPRDLETFKNIVITKWYEAAKCFLYTTEVWQLAFDTAS